MYQLTKHIPKQSHEVGVYSSEILAEIFESPVDAVIRARELTSVLQTTHNDSRVKVSVKPIYIVGSNYHKKIEEQAYLLWEAAGKPQGDGHEYWLQAEQQLCRELTLKHESTM
jgi:hypothetical protein